METTQLEFGGLLSSILVDGSGVLQYGVQHDDGANEVTSWVVSEPDKPFAVLAKLINRIPGESYAIHVTLDGHIAAGVVIRPEDYSLWHVSSTRVSNTETRNFVFGSLELSDDDSLLEASSARAIGEIKILFYRVRGMVPRYEQDYVPPPQAQKVHERAKKGLAHNVKYGGTQLDPLRSTAGRFSCSNQTLVASHVIKYRPLAMLQANGIVPYVPAEKAQNASKSPSPVPGPSSTGNSRKRKALRDEDIKPKVELSDDDEDNIVRKEKELKEQLAQLQKKKARLQHRPANKVKQEERRPNLHGEIIDLTI